MPEISAEILLRPTRIGFLTVPTELASVRRILRAGACLWGGVFNPIIPVFKRAPKEWRPDDSGAKGPEVAKGYIRFFEPDVYIEAKKGLIEEIGLGSLRPKHASHEEVITLKEFLKPRDGRNWAEPAFGLSIQDLLGHIFKTEQQFVAREKRDSVYVVPEAGNALSEAIFGNYPTGNEVDYIKKAYLDVYRPDEVKPTPEVWRKVFLKGAVTPLRVTSHGLETQRYWHHDLIIFVFDPRRAPDLIDLWNLRLEPNPVLPLPLDWFETLSDDIQKILKAEHRPVIGNPNGVMHNATIEFGRSIPKAKAENLLSALKPGIPNGALVAKFWRNRIWIEHRDDWIRRDGRLKITGRHRRVTLALSQGPEISTSFETLEPEFARPYGGHDHRWVNVLRISKYGRHGTATVLPFNTFDRSWPRLGHGGDFTIVGSEGWVFPQQYSKLGQFVTPLSDNDAIVGSLSRIGIKAVLSEPGHIARQMLQQLGSLWKVHLLADLKTLELLNKMAGGLRRKMNGANTVEEIFERRTAPLKDWIDLIAERRSRRGLPRLELEDFTKSNVIRLGLETDCPHCMVRNWTTLTSVDYLVTCERCLKPYDFPQASLREHNRNFAYRVVGPFSVRDYGRGAYSALLSLRFLEKVGGTEADMTYSTAMNLSFDGLQREVDFIAWRCDGRVGEGDRSEPQLIIGETKSLGKGDLIKPNDLSKLRSIAAKLPEAVIVISVLRDHFTKAEKQLLAKFVNWGRRANAHDEPTNPVIVLTSHELTMDYMLSVTWKNLGGVYARFADFEHTRNLTNLADATQQIYLGMPPFREVRQEYWDKRHARQKRKAH